MLTKISTCAFVFALLCQPARAQHSKVPNDPIQAVDAATGQTIPRVLIIPRYDCYAGVFIAPEGPAFSKNHAYLDHPFVYRSGDPFIIKQPRVFTGLPLLMVYIGQGSDLDGILAVAPGYRPLWTQDLWGLRNQERKLSLLPVPNDEWLRILQTDLKPFLNGASHIRDNCPMWNLDKKCDLKLKYDKKERHLVTSFLQSRP